MVDAIRNVLDTGELPEKPADFLGSLIQSDGRFLPQEGVLWDFKREWPFSYSDDYFGGIARLICAFSNTHGGIIIFGVHDELRTAGHNKVTPNVDRLLQALMQILSSEPRISCKRYEQGTSNAIDVLIVRPNDPQTLPIRFTKSIGRYQSGIIWVRQGHEVIAAEPRHVAILYCRSRGDIDTSDDSSITGGLPPSPSTIKRFVGRLTTIDKIFAWLKLSDEPRTFLFGKGGSGKTTIAYEVAKVLKSEGSRVLIGGQEALDNIVFISAKSRTLDVMSQASKPFVGLDFTNEAELYRSILTLTNWTFNPVDELTLDSLRAEVKALFDLTSNFIVIDDIDTLTTQGIEAGFDFLYSTLWRAKRRSKILYTTRSAPSHSLANSIEVPGLEESDYQEFVRVCANQFGVPTPDSEFVSKKLSTISERRPLVVECIIALRRTAGNYDRASQLFQEDTGEDVRSYVFQREWNSLGADNRARYVLAVLAIHGQPLAFADILALLRFEEGKIRDALAEVREMFLQVNEVGAETTFTLGALTRAFILEQSKKLDRYAALKERVDKYKSNFYPENPILSRLRDRVENFLAKATRFNNKEGMTQAWHAITDRALPPKITEDPRFLSLKAYVCLNQSPPNLEEARRLFSDAFAMRFEPDFSHLDAWFFAERDSGHGLNECIRIADFVSAGKKYTDEEKLRFLSLKAAVIYNRGKNEISYSPDTALKDIRDALVLNLACYRKTFDSGMPRVDITERHVTNTGYYLIDFLLLHGRHDTFFDTVIEISSEAGIKLDPLEDPLIRASHLIQRERGTRTDLSKIRGRLEYVKRVIDDKTKWYDRFACERVVTSWLSTANILSSKNAKQKIDS